MGKKRIGFVGLGLMGTVMAKNLMADGFPLIGYDIDPSRVETIVREGGEGIDQAEKLPSRVDVIVTSLPDAQVMEGVIRHSLKLFEVMRTDLILIDTTTGDPSISERLARELEAKGIGMLDATLGGGSGMCSRREAPVMVGGREEIFRRCEDVLRAIGRDVFYVGESGRGALMKLVHNLVIGLNRMVLAEALVLAKRAGLDLPLVLEILRKSGAYSRVMDTKGARMLSKDFFPPESKLAFHLKDVRLILELAQRLQVPLVLSGLHAQALVSAVAKGRGDWDNSAILSFYEDMTAMR